MGTRFPVWSVVAVMFLTSEVVCAQDLPAKPVRLLVPSVAGGPSDFAARLIAPKLGGALDRNVIVDARASVNGIVATEIAAHGRGRFRRHEHAVRDYGFEAAQAAFLKRRDVRQHRRALPAGDRDCPHAPAADVTDRGCRRIE